jgi:neutral ceramidase
MADVKAGFGLVEITPLVGTPLAGQIRVRHATGVNDPLYARVVALADDATSVMIVSCDLCKVPEEDVAAIRAKIADSLPIDPENVWVFATHTHTGPAVKATFETPRASEYASELPSLIVRAAATAWNDMAPAEVAFGSRDVDDLAFVRRYRMRDGTIRTNPRIGDPDVIGPYRQAKTALSIISFERHHTMLPIVIASFPCHADVVGGTDVSADYPGRTCKEMTQQLPGHPETIFLTGACGDINHIDLDAESRHGGYGHAQFMGLRLAEEACKLWEDRVKVSGGLDIRRTSVLAPRRPADADRLAEARTLHLRSEHGGKALSDQEIWTRELILLSQMPDQIELEVTALSVGDMALVATPGELFSPLSEAISDGSPFGNTVVTELAHGGPGYILPADAYTQDGYEERPARTSPFRPGVGESLVEATLKMLRE